MSDDAERRRAPPTEEGWYVLHDLRSVDWDAWRDAPDRERQRALDEGVDYLERHAALADVEGEDGGTAVFSVVGHKADFMVLHLRPTLAALDRAERAFEGTALAGYTEQTDSYLSVTEVSGYMHDDLDAGLENVEDAGMRRYMQQRIYPEIPDMAHVCFYPMDKRRGPDHNWYDLPFDERADLMSAHGDIGREYAGKVTQIISGSVGLDDHEWGVTLFADDPTQIKKLLYEMRFDPSSSRYAEFGTFYFGQRFPPADLPALFAGEAVPSDGGSEGADTTGHAPASERSAEAEHAHGDESTPVSHAHGDEDGSHAHGEASDDGGHPHAAGESGDAAETSDDSDGDHPDTGGGGRPQTPDEAPHEEIQQEAIQREIQSLGVDTDDHSGAGYGLVFYSNADAEALMEEVDGLRSNFDHYDTHVLTTVRADQGRSVAISLWANQRAADTASGFLGDLTDVERGVGGPLPGGDNAADEDAADEADGEHGDADAEDGTAGTDDAETESLREELQDLDVYAGQPHGEDVYAVVLYSEADAGELADEVFGMRERFDHYDTHVKTALYDARGAPGEGGEDGDASHGNGDRTAVVSIWDTADAADTASGFLADLPGVVERAGEESGFGTMGMFYTVKPDYRGEFVDTFGDVGGMLADMEGHFDTDLMVNREDENDMFIASQWRSRDDAMAFFRSDAFRDTVEWGREVLADRPRHVFLA
ncbi:heme-binding protein [Haloglomus salinum]|uniref:heme-binding protein n=1 Tax=Haloglomus salinum TaxID=2962673 RepID=UPI0020C990D9|nr:heme-binding protein [Haloglomus salinum]